MTKSRAEVLAPDDGEGVRLSPQEEQELSAALSEVRAGRYVDGWALLEEPKAKRQALG